MVVGHVLWSLIGNSKTRSSLGIPWPSGRNEFEVDAVQAARKEYFWPNMNRAQRRAFEQAAKKAWDVWIANEAVEELLAEESKIVWRELKNKNETYKVLTPRFVYTDKNDGLRTADHDLEIKASARLVVPGFPDVTAYTIRKGAPTCSRTTQRLALISTSCRYKKGWRRVSADTKSAFLKGDPYMAGVREIYITNIRKTSPGHLMNQNCRLVTGCAVCEKEFSGSAMHRGNGTFIFAALSETVAGRSHTLTQQGKRWRVTWQHLQLC